MKRDSKTIWGNWRCKQNIKMKIKKTKDEKKKRERNIGIQIYPAIILGEKRKIEKNISWKKFYEVE